EQEVDKLPSQIIYDAFDRRGACQVTRERKNCYDDIKNNVRGALQLGDWNRWKTDMTWANQIVENSSYACTKGRGSDPLYYDRCKFLYFWIGTKIKTMKNVRYTYFHTIMNAIYRHMENANFWDACTRPCMNLYPELKDELFEERKILFDYDYNYNYLEKSPECSAYVRTPNYTTHRREAEGAYALLCEHCRTNSNTYCTEFDRIYKKSGQYEKLPELVCTDVPRVKPKLTRTLGSELYSQEVYNLFDNECGDCQCNGRTGEVAAELVKCPGAKQYASAIVNAWHLASKIKEEKTEDGTICSFFYYWLADMLFRNCGLHSIPDIMGRIYHKLRKISAVNNCELLSTDDSMEKFERKKRVFDYSHDYMPVWEQLRTYYGYCKSTYPQVGRSTSQTYYNVNDMCKGNGSNSRYCTQFESKYGNYCEQKSEGLICKSVEEVKTAEEGSRAVFHVLGMSEKEPVSELYASAGTSGAPTVSSILAILAGISSITFLLYKVIITIISIMK
ncbi:hypothetical protein PCYB_002080, partial [Plasmodium cynomolgi strain B]